jgi:arylformamidase
MRTYDITLDISPDMVVWPEDAPVELYRTARMEDGSAANVSRINMSVHTGTHIDAPRHFIADGETIEHMDIDLLTGRAYVLHLPDADVITRDMVEHSPIPPRTKRVLFRTRNSEVWSNGVAHTFIEEYVALHSEAAQYLVDRGVKLIGVDYLSVAPFVDTITTHQILLGAGVVIVEGLDLSKVNQGRYDLYCLPLKLSGSDGAPCRAILTGV